MALPPRIDHCRAWQAVYRAPKQSERGEHFRVAEVGIPAARIRQHEHSRALERLALPSEPHRVLRSDDGAMERDTNDGDDRRPEPSHLAPQNLQAVDVLLRPQRVDARRRTRNEIRDPESPLGQSHVVFVADLLRHEPRVVQQFPESIRVAGEVMTGERGSDAGIDADEKDPHSGTNAIFQQRKIRRFAIRGRSLRAATNLS